MAGLVAGLAALSRAFEYGGDHLSRPHFAVVALEVDPLQANFGWCVDECQAF